jgi:hypothetical protein
MRRLTRIWRIPSHSLTFSGLFCDDGGRGHYRPRSNAFTNLLKNA